MLLLKRSQLFFILLIAANFLATRQAEAQDQISVQGLVSDKETHEPLNGVTASWKNKGIGSISNINGRFIIRIPVLFTPGDSLTFSSIGYRSQNIAIASLSKDKDLMVTLDRSIITLKEVSVKPLTLNQLLDSIVKHNVNTFAPQMLLKGYYREFVYTNAKCTAYADALCAYYYNRVSEPDGQMSITASRCFKESKVNESKDNIEVYKESNLNPNIAFTYAMLSGMIDQYFPSKSLSGYDYTLEGLTEKDSEGLKVVIYPKAGSVSEHYKLTLYLTGEYTLTSCHLEIPEALLPRVKEKSLLGIHSKITATNIDVKYIRSGASNYPSYYAIYKSAKIWGKFLGVTIDQSVINKSEFLASDVEISNLIKPFSRQEIYKKGNICSNGKAMNDQMLKNNTIIVPSAAEAVAIKEFTN